MAQKLPPAPPDVTLLSGPIEAPIQRIAMDLKDFARAIDSDITTCYRAALRGDLIIRKLGRKSIVLMDEGQSFLRALPKGADPGVTAAALAARQSPASTAGGAL